MEEEAMRSCLRKPKCFLVLGSLLLFSVSCERSPIGSAESTNIEAPIHQARIVVLSTNLAGYGRGEWGFAALVEAGNERIFFDAGLYPDTVLKNARELGITLSDVTRVVLSHHHGDHMGGILALRNELADENENAISEVHVAKGIFLSRRDDGEPGEANSTLEIKEKFESTGGVFVEHDRAEELFPGAWLTGPVPRVHPERNWGAGTQIQTSEGWVEDTIPESQSLVLDTKNGLVILSGCGHAGIINTIEYARSQVREAPVHAALGGFHLIEADDRRLEWTGKQLRVVGLKHFLGAHCTGIEAVFRIREHTGLDRRNCVVGAVGASFELTKGLDPLDLAR